MKKTLLCNLIVAFVFAFTLGLSPAGAGNNDGMPISKKELRKTYKKILPREAHKKIPRKIQIHDYNKECSQIDLHNIDSFDLRAKRKRREYFEISEKLTDPFLTSFERDKLLYKKKFVSRYYKNSLARKMRPVYQRCNKSPPNLKPDHLINKDKAETKASPDG